MYVTEQLESVAALLLRADEVPRMRQGSTPRRADSAILLLLHELNAYFFHVRAQAWRRFCQEHRRRSRRPRRGQLPRMDARSSFEEQMSSSVPDQERILDRLAESGEDAEARSWTRSRNTSPGAGCWRRGRPTRHCSRWTRPLIERIECSNEQRGDPPVQPTSRPKERFRLVFAADDRGDGAEVSAADRFRSTRVR